MVKRFAQTIILLLLCTPLAGAEQPKPMPNTYVHDFANVISPESKKQLQEKAKKLKEQFKIEIALVTIESLNGEDQLDYSVKMMRDWGISSPDNEIKGMLILVATQDRKTSFRTSRYIEGEFPDGVIGDIRRQMDEYFKKQDFGGGLLLGLDKISERLAAQGYTPQEKPQTKSGSKVGLWILLGCLAVGGLIGLIILRAWKRAKAAERELKRKRALTVAETRKNYFAVEKKQGRQTGHKTMQNKIARQEAKQKRKEAEREARRLRQGQNRPATASGYTSSSSSSNYEPSSYSSSSSSDYNSYNDYSSSSSYDSGSSSDSGSVYSGGSDAGGGGSDSSW